MRSMVIAKSGCKQGRGDNDGDGSSSDNCNSSKDDKIEEKKNKSQGGGVGGIMESTSVVNIRNNQQRSSLTIDASSKRKSAMSRQLSNKVTSQ